MDGGVERYKDCGYKAMTHHCQAVDVVLLTGHPKLSCRAGVGEGGEHKNLTRPQQSKQQVLGKTVNHLLKDLGGRRRYAGTNGFEGHT